MLLGFLGLPSLHSIVEAIANGFFGALAAALVPGFLKHGTVATIQHLVALPDPGTWPHVGALQQNMVWLGVLLMPVTLTVGTLRYWLVGLTGQAHPVLAVGRCSWVTGVLVGYRWLVEQAVAATNTLTHAILGFPSVGDGLTRVISVLFGGALLTGTGGVFGAFLVIIGVIFAAALFAIQVLVTVLLALLVVAGPPLIAVSPIPELSHLARAWGYALLAVSLVPIAWTVLFATAGALSLDATSFTGASGGLPGHVAAAFAGLITFVLAVRLPLMLLGETRHLLTGPGGRSGGLEHGGSPVPGADRVRAGHARLRTVAFQAFPSLGRSVGLAAGALGTPAGGPVGAAGRLLQDRRSVRPAHATGVSPPSAGGRAPRRSVRDRVALAGRILRDAPGEARNATRKTVATRASRVSRSPSSTSSRERAPGSSAVPSTQKAASAVGSRGVRPPVSNSKHPAGVPGRATPEGRSAPGPAGGRSLSGKPTTRSESTTHPGRRLDSAPRQRPTTDTTKPAKRERPRPEQRPAPPPPRSVRPRRSPKREGER